VTVANADITAGLPKRELTLPYILQMASGKTLPILKKVLAELNLGRHLLLTWVFIARIANQFILGLDALPTYDLFMDVGPHVLQLDNEVPLWCPWVQPHSFSYIKGSSKVCSWSS
jgi:hypothetical protein